MTRIVLTGFMGAGKSTLGALLALRLGWGFLDADAELVRKTRNTVADLFERYGEAAFRELETEVVAELLLTHQTVIALGGGALESGATRARLMEDRASHTVFLETPLEVAIARCESEPGGASRPILADRAHLAQRFASRLEHYRRAHTTLATVGRGPEELAELLIQGLPPLDFTPPPLDPRPIN